MDLQNEKFVMVIDEHLPSGINPHEQFLPCRVRLFQERYHGHRRRLNDAGTGSGSRCYTGNDLYGVNRGMETAATPGSVAGEM